MSNTQLPSVPARPTFRRLRTAKGYERARDYYLADAAWCDAVVASGVNPPDSVNEGQPLDEYRRNNYTTSAASFRDAAKSWQDRADRARAKQQARS